MTTTGHVHLVGSVPLENNRQVFELCSGCLGDRLRCLPDGETGERSKWIRWQYPVLAQCRFQVSLPTPLAPMQFYVTAEHRALIEPIYEARLITELDDIAQAIPATELAIQWDTAAEFGIIEGVFASWFENEQTEILERLIRLGNAVPDGVELGYHLCYGDSGQKHFTEPTDTTHLPAVANGIAASIERTLNWIHLPVPKERIDREYYQPLKNLELSPETEIYLGLIHDGEGADTNTQRIEAAKSALNNFGLATECGFGRRPAETVQPLIETHAQLAATNEQS